MANSWTQDGYPNLEAPYLIPEEFRVPNRMLMRTFDTIFRPQLTDIFPAEQSPNGGMQRFDWPIITTAQPMARLYDNDEPTRYLGAPAVKQVSFSTVTTKNGFIRRFDEFKQMFTDNVIDAKYQVLARDMVMGINKRIEWEIANILYMNTDALRHYSPDQELNRGLVADIKAGKFYKYDKTTEITELGSLLSGAQWHANNSDIFRDLAAIKRAHEDMKGETLTKGFIGPETAMWMDFNSEVVDRLKYHVSTLDGVMGMSLMGIKFKKLIGNNLKEASENQTVPGGTPRFGEPGLGDLDYDKWGDRNKVPICVDGGTTGREWGILSEDVSGRLFCAYVDTLHQAQARSAVEPFTYEFAEQDPFRVKVRMERSFCPVVEDFANYVLLVNTVNRSNR